MTHKKIIILKSRKIRTVMDQILKKNFYKIRIIKKTNNILLIIVIKIRKTQKIQTVIDQIFKIKINKIRKI